MYIGTGIAPYHQEMKTYRILSRTRCHAIVRYLNDSLSTYGRKSKKKYRKCYDFNINSVYYADNFIN